MYRFHSSAIECIHSMICPLNVYIQWLSTFNTTYTHIHKVSNYFAICGPPVDQQYVYHSGRRWTTDGPPVANLTIFCVIKFKTATHTMSNSHKPNKFKQRHYFSRSVKTNAVQQTLAHQLCIVLIDHSCMCQIKKIGIILGFIKTQNYIKWKK